MICRHGFKPTVPWIQVNNVDRRSLVLGSDVSLLLARRRGTSRESLSMPPLPHLLPTVVVAPGQEACLTTLTTLSGERGEPLHAEPPTLNRTRVPRNPYRDRFMSEPTTDHPRPSCKREGRGPEDVCARRAASAETGRGRRPCGSLSPLARRRPLRVRGPAPA